MTTTNHPAGPARLFACAWCGLETDEATDHLAAAHGVTPAAYEAAVFAALDARVNAEQRLIGIFGVVTR